MLMTADPVQQLLTSLSERLQLAGPVCNNIAEEYAKSANLTQAIGQHTTMSEREILAFYAQTLNLPLYPEQELMYPIHDAVSLKFLRQQNVLALAAGDEQVQLITATPYDPYPLQAVELATEQSVSVSLASATWLAEVLEKADSDAASVSELSDQIEDDYGFSDEDDVDRLKDLASEAPIVRLVNIIISQAMALRASDIHIEPFERQLRVRYRIDGVLTDADAPPIHSAPAIISRIKIMAKLNIAERRLPQDGRIQLRLQGHQVELRVSTIPSLFGESVVMRILDKTQLNLRFESLGFGDNNINRLTQLIDRPHGIILVTGPTGSGKTTTLYTALASLNATDNKIMTVEDPVEYQLDGVMQMQVKPSIGLSFADALRAIVRQDPDTIMIGEMRDYETASIAIQSALTGHLVFSTLHTNDAGSAITRLLDMGVEDYLITSTVAGVVAQRLVRTLCPHCRQAVTPVPELLDELGIEVDPEQPPLQFYEPVGCDECNGLGYRGRTVILEQMNIDDALRSTILSKADGTTIQNEAIRLGMKTMRQDGIEKALAGVTSLDEVMSATQDK